MDERRPKTVKVTVYSSRNIKPRKGDGDPLAWVVFGFGKEKCCTAQIRERNAKWNEESTFTITDPKLPLKLNIKDKDDPIGQIIIPLSDIPCEEHFLKWVPVGPHKKNSNPTGEICIDCWVEDFYEDDDITHKHHKTLFNKTFNRLTGKSPEAIRKQNSPEMKQKSPVAEDRRFSVSTGVTSMKGSVSIEDLSGTTSKNKKFGSLNKFKDQGLLAPPAAYTQSNIRKATSTLDISSKEPASSYKRFSAADVTSLGQLPAIKEQNYPPKITTITPTSGPKTGGTLIQITGKNLGFTKDDINRLSVGGCNCLSTIEYYTPNKIMCTTSESTGIGPITMSTRSGGMSSSKMMFEFVEVEKQDNNNAEWNTNKLTETSTDSGRSSNSSTSGDDKELIDGLRHEIDDLKYDNRELKEYIDRLVLYLMDKYPDALESTKMYCRR